MSHQEWLGPLLVFRSTSPFPLLFELFLPFFLSLSSCSVNFFPLQKRRLAGKVKDYRITLDFVSLAFCVFSFFSFFLAFFGCFFFFFFWFMIRVMSYGTYPPTVPVPVPVPYPYEHSALQIVYYI